MHLPLRLARATEERYEITAELSPFRTKDAQRHSTLPRQIGGARRACDWAASGQLQLKSRCPF